MTMSRDRVRFTFSDKYVEIEKNAIAASKAFGIPIGKARALFEVRAIIICRPSQFARFIIYRSERVACNRIQQLRAELFTPQEECGMDVSRNSA